MLALQSRALVDVNFKSITCQQSTVYYTFSLTEGSISNLEQNIPNVSYFNVISFTSVDYNADYSTQFKKKGEIVL